MSPRIALLALLLTQMPNPNYGIRENYVNGSGAVAGDVTFPDDASACFRGSGTQEVGIEGMGDAYCAGENRFAGTTRSADETPTTMVLAAQHTYPVAASDTPGADLILSGGQGRLRGVVTAANCPGDSIVVYVNGTNIGTCTETGTNGANTFDCTGETDAVCASAMATCIGAKTGISACAGNGCTTSHGFVGVSGTAYAIAEAAEGGVHVILSPSDGTCFNQTTGTRGAVVVAPTASGTNRAVMYLGGKTSSDVMIRTQSGGSIDFRTGTDSAYVQITASHVISTGGSGFISLDQATQYLKQWSGAAFDTSFYRSAAGIWSTGTGTQATKIGDLSEVCNAASVNTNTLTAQTIFTVPSGKVFWPRSALARDSSAIINTATWTLDCTATNDTDDTGFGTMSFVTTNVASGTGTMTWFKTSAAGAECAAASNVAYDGVAAEGAADTITIEVCGVLR